MLKKKLLSFLLSFGMLASPLTSYAAGNAQGDNVPQNDLTGALRLLAEERAGGLKSIYADEESAPARWEISEGAVSFVADDKGGNASTKFLMNQGWGTAKYQLDSAVSSGNFVLEYEMYNEGGASSYVIYDVDGNALINIGTAGSGNINILPGKQDGDLALEGYSTTGKVFATIGATKNKWAKVVINVDLDKSNADGVLNYTLQIYVPSAAGYQGADTVWELFEGDSGVNEAAFSQDAYIKAPGNLKGGNQVTDAAGNIVYYTNGAATPDINSFAIGGIQMTKGADSTAIYYDNMSLQYDAGSSRTEIYTEETDNPAGWTTSEGAVSYSSDEVNGNSSNKFMLNKVEGTANYQMNTAVSKGIFKAEYEVFNNGSANSFVVYDSNGNALINIGGAKSGNFNIMPNWKSGLESESAAGDAVDGQVFAFVGLAKQEWVKIVVEVDLDKSNAEGVLNYTLQFYKTDNYQGSDTVWKEWEGGDGTYDASAGAFTQDAYISNYGGNKGTNFVTEGGTEKVSHANGAATAGITSFDIAGVRMRTLGTAEVYYDNMAVEYASAGYSANDVIGVTNPSSVTFNRKEYDDFTFPTTVTVTMGDDTTKEVAVGEWTASPAFDAEVGGTYVWSAPLVLEDGMNNVRNLSARFTMRYIPYQYPTYAYNPMTLELEFGQELTSDMFPTEVDAVMNDGKLGKVQVGEWQAIRAFNAEEEGIYVYGAKLAPTPGEINIMEDELKPNENPTASDNTTNDYDVYFRVGYFKSEDNYNAYQRTMERLDRGTYAIATEEGVFVSWRLLATEYGEDISFNVKRNGVVVNTEPITSKTNFLDAEGKAGDTYIIETTMGDKVSESAEVNANDKNYISIPVQKPEPQPNVDGSMATYTLNDAGVADVDGDGQYEFIVKWYPSNAFDSGVQSGPSSPTIFDVYRLDGTALWRLNMGLEMPSGAHFNQFMFYDLDEDGKAELFIKTSDGTTTYKPNAEGKFDMTDESTLVSYIGDKSVVPGTNIDGKGTTNKYGHVNSGSNEYVTVFNGQTGEEISTIPFVNTTGNYSDWGKNDGGNRSARYNIAIAYLPKDQDDPNCKETIPAVLFNRGYYAKTTVAAYTLREGELNLEWNFVAETGTTYAGKGNHNVSTGDMDGDGFDELVIGAMAIDHDGSVLWANDGQEGRDFGGHGDAIHLSAMTPNSNKLYVFAPQEDKNIATLNHGLYNAGTGTRIGGSWFTTKDVGRAIAANITPNPGFEYWSTSDNSGIYNFYGDLISQSRSGLSVNWRLYWDGDLLSELGDGIGSEDDDMQVTKYNWETGRVDTVITFEGTKTCNSTKKTPSLTADLFGDWREEVVLRNDADDELRIYMTTEDTDYMIYTLMHDPVYRNAVANQNTSYNQPPHLGIYLGEDTRDQVLAMELPTANIKYAGDENPDNPDNPDDPEKVGDLTLIDGKYYYYDENGDMVTSAEVVANGEVRWFDEDGAMAVDKDVYVPDSDKWVRYDEEGKRITGEDCRYGGWYRFDEETGAMIKGWYTTEDGRKYYYDPMTGQMIHGAVDVDGVHYYFDDITGVAANCVWGTVDGEKYWYENGVRQGLEGRGKEIYDPASKAWYWLDSNNGGKMAVSKDVYQESAAGPWAEKEDGTGKWVRYDEQGHMVKGWDVNKDGKYYFDLVYGTMAKGTVTIEGEEYTFDEVTGVLIEE